MQEEWSAKVKRRPKWNGVVSQTCLYSAVISQSEMFAPPTMMMLFSPEGGQNPCSLYFLLDSVDASSNTTVYLHESLQQLAELSLNYSCLPSPLPTPGRLLRGVQSNDMRQICWCQAHLKAAGELLLSRWDLPRFADALNPHQHLAKMFLRALHWHLVRPAQIMKSGLNTRLHHDQ